MTTEELLAAREKTHGDYRDHAAITQRLKKVMRSSSNWEILGAPETEALEMIAHKIGRILAGDPRYADHWEDIAGYAKLVANMNGEGPR